MKKWWMVGLGMLFSASSMADSNVVLGTGLGAAMGAVIGHQIDHDKGAWVGGAVGAVTGAVVAGNQSNSRQVVDYDPYRSNGYGYNVYSNTPRRDIYVVEPGYYQRPPAQVIYVDDHRGRGHRHHHHHRGHGYSGYGNPPQTVVIVR